MSMNNKIQSSPIQINLQIKNEPKNSNKSLTTITKKNNQTRKKTLNDLKNNKPLDNNPQPKGRIKTNSQAPNQIRTRKSIPVTQYSINNNVNSNIKLNNSWLNKYFIYRHDSLNNYLFKDEFRNTLDKSAENYYKKLNEYRRIRLDIPQKNPSNGITSYNKSVNSNIIKDEKNNPHKKTFIVTGGYADVVRNLTQRGWVREPKATSLDFDYIWTLKTNEINFIQLKNYQMANHYFRNGQITRKSGLSKNIKNLYFLGADPMNFFPRCYDLSVKSELEDFKQDFKFTWTISLLIMFQKEANEQGNNSGKSKRFSTQVIETAINIIERHLFLLEENGSLKDINNLKNSQKIYLISEQEWNLIYLPELTQNSDVQDIIYEVNSNKPGGVNNPIKGKSNTVQKKLIKKPNDTKNMLINTQKPGAIDTNKFSPNLQSYAGLKAKYNQMNLEEKKNNFNININNNNLISNSNTIIRKKLDLQNNNNALSQKNNIIIKNINAVKRSTIVRNGALFKDFLPKVNSLLNTLKQFLPQYKLNGFRNIWILKPSNLSRGRGVTCVNSLEPIEQSLNATNDTGVVVQKYIENPLIINKRKFDIRQWVLVTSLNPLTIWMWKEPYLRFGAEDYIMDDLNNIYSHLTNNSIAKHSLQYKNEKKFKEDMWTCFDFENYIGKTKWKEIHEKIKNAIICSFYAIHQEIKARYNSHELYGYDFMIDEDYNVYLIEVNASPALDYSTKITEMLVKSMVGDLIELVIDNDNARLCSLREGNISENNKFVQIFNESKEKIEFPKNIPNKGLFY